MLRGVLKPLKSLEASLAKNTAPTCEQVYLWFKLQPPVEGYESRYNYDASVESDRLTFK